MSFLYHFKNLQGKLHDNTYYYDLVPIKWTTLMIILRNTGLQSIDLQNTNSINVEEHQLFGNEKFIYLL